MAGKATVKAQREDGAVKSPGLAVAGSLTLILVSAFAVIHSSHACRKLYAELQALESTQWHLQEEYGRLLLEQSTWASHRRVQQVAQDELGMLAPPLERLRLVAP